MLSDRDRRVLLLLEQELLRDDPVWMHRVAPLLAGDAARHGFHRKVSWLVLEWAAVLCGVLLVVKSTSSSSPWELVIGIYLAGGAAIALLTTSA